MLIKIDQNFHKHLTETEHTVITFLNAHVEDIMRMSITDVAEATYSSPATVSRTIKKCGFSGFAELRYRVARETESAGHDSLAVNEIFNKSLLEGFRMLFTGRVGKDDIAGPVGLVKIVNTAADYGIAPYLMLLAIVSLNLAIFNLIPIPGLDGGKIFFILLKIISGGRINDDMEYKATVIGMIVLLTLFALITLNDVMNLFG